MHVAVLAFLDEILVLLESKCPRVLQDKQGTIIEDVRTENLVWNALEIVYCIGRIGKHEIELFSADGKEVKDIVMDYLHSVKPESSCCLLYETGISRIHLDRDDVPAAA